MANGNEGSTPALGDAQARKLLEAPPADTLKGACDRAILATLLYHGIRREELCGLRVKDIQSRQGVVHFRVKGKRGKVRSCPCMLWRSASSRNTWRSLATAMMPAGPVFRPVTNNRTKELERPLDPNSAYRNIVQKYGLVTGIKVQINGLCVHSLRATVATNALSHEADIARVQEWLGHANVSTTRPYDRRKVRPEDSPTIRVRY
jgi:integrase/recombinase XerD